jgi:hypothetical protein
LDNEGEIIMSGELNLKYSAINKTILALILGQNRTTRWNGTAMAPIGSIADDDWTTGMIALTEQTTQNNTNTAIYVGDFPAGIADSGEYVIDFYLGTAATPGSPSIGVQDIWWDGTKMISPAETPLVDVVRIGGNPVSDDGHGRFLPASLDWLAIRSGSTRTVINVNGNNQYKTWAENVLKGFMAIYENPSGGDSSQIPCVIISNTEIKVPGEGGGSITLAGDGLPQAPTGGLISLLLHSHADIVDVLSKTNRIPNDPAAVGSAMTLQSAERDAIAAALLDLANTIDGKTLRQALQIIAAVLAGKVSGAGSGIETFRTLDDLHDRVVVTADITGNRINVTYP